MQKVLLDFRPVLGSGTRKTEGSKGKKTRGLALGVWGVVAINKNIQKKIKILAIKKVGSGLGEAIVGPWHPPILGLGGLGFGEQW